MASSSSRRRPKVSEFPEVDKTKSAPYKKLLVFPKKSEVIPGSVGIINTHIKAHYMQGIKNLRDAGCETILHQDYLDSTTPSRSGGGHEEAVRQREIINAKLQTLIKEREAKREVENKTRAAEGKPLIQTPLVSKGFYWGEANLTSSGKARCNLAFIASVYPANGIDNFDILGAPGTGALHEDISKEDKALGIVSMDGYEARSVLEGESCPLTDDGFNYFQALTYEVADHILEVEAKQRAEEEARRKAEEERQKAEEARRKAEEEARRKAEEDMRKAEEARRKAEEEAKQKAEEERLKAEEERLKAEAKQKAEEAAKLKDTVEKKPHPVVVVVGGSGSTILPAPSPAGQGLKLDDKLQNIRYNHATL